MDHLLEILDEVRDDDPRVMELTRRVHERYVVTGLGEGEISRSARLGVALGELVDRFRLDGLVLLGQHLIEARANAAVYLGLSELLLHDRAVATTEGDVIGCVMSKVLKDFTGTSPFFGEWEEVDVELNAVMLLGHGFVDPRAVRQDRPVQVKPACENWGFEGDSLGFEATYPPGPVTLAHGIHDVDGWRLLVSSGELLDTEPLPINESSLIIRVDKPVKAYLRELIELGFAHHVIAVSGDVTRQLELFARQAGIRVDRL
jgi:L-fucose isomerase-like protein